MTFAPALSLGVASLDEYVDVKITDDLDPSSLLDQLTASSPDGIRFFGAVRLGGNDAGITRVVDTARYAVGIPRSVLPDFGGEVRLRERAQELMAANEARVLRRIDGVGKWVDVREYLRALEVASPVAAEALEKAGIVGDFVTLLVDLEIRGSGAIKISEVMEVLGRGVGAPPVAAQGKDRDEEVLPHRSVRVALGLSKEGRLLSPLDLDGVRKPAPVREPTPSLEASAE
jgi:radical SAM-linked protein